MHPREIEAYDTWNKVPLRLPVGTIICIKPFAFYYKNKRGEWRELPVDPPITAKAIKEMAR